MKKYIFILLLSSFIFSCSKEDKDIFQKYQLMGTWEHDVVSGFIGGGSLKSTHYFHDLTFSDSTYLLVTRIKYFENDSITKVDSTKQEGSYIIKSKFVELVPNPLSSWGELKLDNLIFRQGIEKEYVFRKTKSVLDIL